MTRPAGYVTKSYPEMGAKRAHRAVYEAAFGPIPAGYGIHHIDGDPRNYALGNLVPLTQRDHMRIHAGWEQRDGEWFKPCGGCGEMKPESTYYHRKNGHNTVFHLCPPCATAKALDYQRRKKEGQLERVGV